MKKQDGYLWNIIPKYAVLPLICSFTFNSLIYTGTQILCSDLKHYDFTTAFDRAVPVIPAFTSIYLICYLFWAVNYIMIGRIGKEHLYRFLVGDFLSRIICGAFFVLIPTTLARPEISGSGIWDQMLRLVYTIDPSANLFPSIHCLVSWFCYVGIRGQKKIPVWYQRFSCIFAVLVCVSTQVTKQHYIIDLIAGVLLAEAMYLVGQKTDWYLKLQSAFTKINRGVHLERAIDKEVGYGE